MPIRLRYSAVRAENNRHDFLARTSMNMHVPARARLRIEVVHDLICPWCRLGVHRLLHAIATRPDLIVDLSWRSFLLNPDMPLSGLASADYMRHKFGGEERARRLYHTITEIGAAEGLIYRFDRIQRTPPSVDAHRLVRWGAQFGRATPLVEALFAAHFEEGRDIGDVLVLGEIAAACGLDPVAARALLLSPNGADAIRADNLYAHRLGINGVPCFILDGHSAIAGAQEPEVLDRLLDVAASHAAS